MPIGSYVSKAKASVLYVLQILENHSSKENPLSALDIKRQLEQEPYNMKVDRDTVKATLEELVSFYGEDVICNVISEKNNGEDYKYAWYYNKQFSDEEIVSLIADVLNSKNRAVEEAAKTTVKLKEMLSPTYQLKYEYVVDGRKLDKNKDSYELFNNLNTLIDITKDNINTKDIKQISFRLYNHQIEDNKIVLKPLREKEYELVPVAVIENNKHYYLIGFHKNSSNLMHFRVDLIKDIKIKKYTGDLFNLRTTVFNKTGYEMEIDKYISNHLYMFYETEDYHGVKNVVTNITLKIYKKGKVGFTFFVDAFGKDYKIIENTDKYIIVKVKCIPSALVLFIKQYMERVEVLEPTKIRKMVYEVIKEDLERLLEESRK